MDNRDLINIRDRFKALWADIHHVSSMATDSLVARELLTDTRALAYDLSKAIATREARTNITTSTDDQMIEFLAGTIGVVDANSFEQHALWRFNRDKNEPHLSWDQKSGLGQVIGHFGDMPVNLSLSPVVIDGHKILFIDPVSQVVHHEMIDKWLDATMPASARTPDDRVNRTNAMNFHNIFHYVDHG